MNGPGIGPPLSAPGRPFLQPPYRSPPTFIAGLLCHCPRCGRGRLFKGFLDLAKSCSVCGLDYGFADPPTGPAFFVMGGVSIVIMGLWAWWAGRGAAADLGPACCRPVGGDARLSGPAAPGEGLAGGRAICPQGRRGPVGQPRTATATAASSSIGARSPIGRRARRPEREPGVAFDGATDPASHGGRAGSHGGHDVHLAHPHRRPGPRGPTGSPGGASPHRSGRRRRHLLPRGGAAGRAGRALLHGFPTSSHMFGG